MRFRSPIFARMPARWTATTSLASAQGRSRSSTRRSSPRGLIKLVVDAGNGRLLGAHILAPEGADSIQTATVSIRQGLTVDDLADTIFPYLTTVERLKLAALGFAKDLARLSCCAG